MKRDKVIYFLGFGMFDGDGLLPINTPIRPDEFGRTTAKVAPHTERLSFAWESNGSKYVGVFQVAEENYGIRWDGDVPKINLDEAILEGWLDMDISGKHKKTFVTKARLYLRIGV